MVCSLLGYCLENIDSKGGCGLFLIRVLFGEYRQLRVGVVSSLLGYCLENLGTKAVWAWYIGGRPVSFSTPFNLQKTMHPTLTVW